MCNRNETETDCSRLAELAARLGLHEHLCLIYDSREEQFAVALPYLRAGLESGERCFYIADENTTADVLDGLRAGGTDVDRYLRSGALTVASKIDLSPEEAPFDPDRMFGFWVEAIRRAEADGFSGLRVLAEMTWTFGENGIPAGLIELESRLNHLVRDSKVGMICQYRRARFPAKTILDVVRTHPTVAYRGLICKNPYYVPPEELLKPNRTALEVDRLLKNILEWERAHADLRESEERFRTLFQSVQVGVIVNAPDTKVLTANPAALDILGMSEEQLIGSSSYDSKWRVVYDDGSPCAPGEHPLTRAIATRQPVRNMVVGVDRPLLGDRIWLLVNATPQYAPDGSVNRVVCAFLDVTERKRAEEDLRRSEAYLAAGQRLSHTGSWAFNVSSGDLFWSEETFRIFGFDPATKKASVAETFFPRLHPEDRPRIERGIKEAEAVTGSYAADYRIVLPDGSVKHIHDVVYPVTNGTGQVIERYGVVMDVTERKRSEEELRRSEAYLAAGQRLSQTGSWAWNIASGELFWSEETFRIFGFDPATTEASVEETFLQRIHPEDRPSMERRVKGTSKDLKNYEGDYRIVLPDGSVKYIHEIVYAVTNGAGRAIERYGVVMDVTDRRQSEQKIESLRRQLEMERDYLREELKESQAFGEILGGSHALKRVLSQVDLVAPTDATVLILGESGTGKELVARAIHQRSPRRERPLVKVNCGSIPRELFESEFFGHVKGAFTGALRTRVGRFELADRGTLFLDEVSEIPLELQSKLLRVLQEGEFERVGEESTRRVDVRVIAASNRDLQKEVESCRFRLDLFHRLAVFPIQVPPLRHRREDIPILAAHFVEQICSSSNLPRPRLRQGDIEALERYDWPGNVRELQNVIERAVILARGGPLQIELPADSTAEPRPRTRPVEPSNGAGILTEEEWRAKERENLERALRQAGGRISGPSGAAEILGIHPNTLTSRLKALGLSRKV
jgi:PAS domain S-box-containing protein